MSNDKNKKIAVFTQGLPGAGKSFIVGREYGNADIVVDPDAIKASHPDYDPKDPQALHAWSKEISESQIRDALSNPVDLLVVDGTGTNAEKIVRRIREAQAVGYECHLVYVRVSLKTSLARNAARARTVPERVVREKALDIATAYEIVSSVADVSRIINND